MIDRLSRAEGQIRALKELLEAGTPDCTKFITQVKAARSALRGVSEEYVIHHIHACQAHTAKKRDVEISEAIKLLAKD
jgi:DNA-binding FrmR family transcriptional regulator